MKKQTKFGFYNRIELFIAMIKNGLLIALVLVKPYRTKPKLFHKQGILFFTYGSFASSSLQNPIKNIICSPE
jgi:hypothetical protein